MHENVLFEEYMFNFCKRKTRGDEEDE